MYEKQAIGRPIIEPSPDWYLGYAAHTIGHKEITISNNNVDTGDNNNDINANVDAVVSRNVGDSTDIPVVETDTGETLRNAIQSGKIASEIDENDSEISNNRRTLIVISIRGSVTPLDWAMDFASQIDLEGANFEAGCREIMESLDAYKTSYKDEINNPIILVTGHSLGAAIANLVADELNNGVSSADVYAYTFATPNTVNFASGKQAIPYTNVFNILNNNDAVPHFPMDILCTAWERHGQDFHITMPLNVDWILGVDLALLGAAGHAMPNYYSWLNNLPGALGKSAEDITVADLEEMSVDYAVGFGAKLLKVLCPVTVTLYDTDGSIVPFESRQNDAEYPKISDTGIVSWITDDGGKMFLFPYGMENIEARIEAYDYGTMTLTVEQPGLGEPLDTITYNNVNLYPDKEFKVNIDEEFSSEDVALVQVKTDEDGNEIETEITDLNPYLISASVNVDEIVHGQPCTITIVTHKDAVKTQIQYNGTAATVTFIPEHDWVVSVDPVGDTLVWTIQPILNRIGEHVFDVNVKVGSTWYYTEKVFALTIT